MEESKGQDVSPCSLPYKWRSFLSGFVFKAEILHLLQRASCCKFPKCDHFSLLLLLVTSITVCYLHSLGASGAFGTVIGT